MINKEAILTDLREKGLAILPGVYSKSTCDDYVRRGREMSDRLLAEGKDFNEICQFISSPFRYDPKFFDLLWHPDIDQILSTMLDEDYVLINTNLINRKFRDDLERGKAQGIGGDWHTDSRYLDGKRLDSGFGFIVVTMLTDFTPDNAGTLYVPGSHLRRDRPERQANYDCQQICGEAGSVVIYDSGLWHRAGDATPNDRWGLFSLYGGWFVKPYFRFPDMLGEEFGKTLSKPMRRLLHYTSWPPLHADERFNTVIKE